jgi:uncharacterized protein with HEPN domain
MFRIFMMQWKRQKILSITGHSKNSADLKTQFAVIRALEIIGEATKNIPFEVREKYPSVP